MRWTWLKLRVVTDLSENIMVTISCVHGSATFSQLHYSRTPRASINIDARPSNPFLQRVCRGVNWQTLLRHPRKILRDQLLPGLNRWMIIISRRIFKLSDYLYCFETLRVTDLCIFVHFLRLEIYNRYLILVFQIFKYKMYFQRLHCICIFIKYFLFDRKLNNFLLYVWLYVFTYIRSKNINRIQILHYIIIFDKTKLKTLYFMMLLENEKCRSRWKISLVRKIG